MDSHHFCLVFANCSARPETPFNYDFSKIFITYNSIKTNTIKKQPKNETMKTRIHEIEKELREVSDRFSVKIKHLRPEFEISGSPERTDFRTVVESDEGLLYVMECFDETKITRKKTIGETVNKLNIHGLKKTLPYLRTENGNPIYQSHGLGWQMSPYIESEEILRPDWAFTKDTGAEFAEFIIQMISTSKKIGIISADLPFFSIKKYIRSIALQISEHNPEITELVNPAIDFLEKSFFKSHDSLREGFCHGDIHPLNAIWKNGSIIAVIDWEFMGIKPEIYDLANLLGCIGMESPESLGGEHALTLISKLKEADTYEKQSWDVLIDFVMAVRFGWLSEWLRKKDHEMIKLETDYMDLLLKYGNDIQKTWDAV